MFAEPASGWATETESEKLIASDGAAGNSLGYSVAVSGPMVLAGALRDRRQQFIPGGELRAPRPRRDGDVSLKLPGVFGGITGQVQLRADQQSGLQVGGLHIAVPDAWIFGFEVKGADLRYDQASDSWHAASTIVLPTPNRTAIGASVDFVHGQPQAIEAHTGNLQIPIGPAVCLQNLACQCSSIRRRSAARSGSAPARRSRTRQRRIATWRSAIRRTRPPTC